MRATIILIATAVAAFCLTQPLFAQSVDEIKSQAEAGDADSQGLLSLLIQWKEVDLSDTKAVELANESADAGSPFGAFAVGLIYAGGYGGVAKDADEAAAKTAPAVPDMLSKAEAGDAWAAYLLGITYSNGRGVEKNQELARKWLRKAAEQGNALGQLVNFSVSLAAISNKLKAATSEAQIAALMAEIDEEQATVAAIKSNPPHSEQFRKMAQEQIWAFQLLHASALSMSALKVKSDTSDATIRSVLADLDKAQAIVAAAKTSQPPSEEGRKRAEELMSSILEGKKELSKLKQPSSVAEVADMINRPLGQLNSTANVEDPEPGKFDGPDTQTVIKIANLGFASAGDPSMVMTIKRGQPLVATEGGAIPAGTKIFPIRIKTGLIDYDYAFYQDPFGEWQAQQRSYQ